MIKNVVDLYMEHAGKVTDTWALYLDELDRLFSPYRSRPIRLLEIGVQNGGSLEIWGKYFTKAVSIVGCDIDQKCGQLEFPDDRISVVVGDANTNESENSILQKAQSLDIVIDDGSHMSGDVICSFARYFPHLSDGGMYIIEDLHCSYWNNYHGGLYNPLSSIAFLKRLVDIINYEHWRNNQKRSSLLAKFLADFNIEFDDFQLARIHSIEFINTLCIIRKSAPDKN